MARKHVARHQKRIEAHRIRHRKGVYKVLKKLVRHRGCYKDGGMMLYGMGMKKKKAGMMLYGMGMKKKAGMMLYGMGMRKPGYKKKKIKLPAWYKKKVPKSGKFPSAPRSFNKKAAGLWADTKARAKKIQDNIKVQAKKLWEHGKKVGAKVGADVLSNLGDKADGLVGQVGDLVDNHLDQLGGVAENYINTQVDRGAKKASAYAKKKGGRFNPAMRAAGNYNIGMSNAQYKDQQRFNEMAKRNARANMQRLSIGGRSLNSLNSLRR